MRKRERKNVSLGAAGKQGFRVNILDVIIGLFVVLCVARGVRTGFLAGALALVGLVVGASLGSRLAPMLMGREESLISGAAITLASTVAFAVLGDVIGCAVGRSISGRLGGASGKLDGVGGAVLGLTLSLTLVWVGGVLALQAPLLTGLQPVVEDSSILRTLEARMPSSLITRAAAEFNPLPRISGPEPDVPEPERDIVQDPEVLAAGSSTVRVAGVACGYGVEGSGWVAAPDLVVTNAHVVAGESVTRVQPGGEGRLSRAEVISFDRRNDIAILRVENLGVPVLAMDSPESGEAVGILGYPESGPLDISPGRTGPTQRVLSTDAYSRGPIERVVTSFRVYVRPGNSGGPAVNADGEVVATIFASRADSNDSGFGISSRLVERRLQSAAGRTEPVSTGGCAQ